MGRLVKSRKDGPLSSGGFVGRFCDNIPEPLAGVSELRLRHAYQYKLYLNESLDSEINQFKSYKSQFGGQALLLSILDRIMVGKNSFRLKFYYHLMAAISAVIIFIIILWFAKEFDLLTGWLMVISFSLFCYPTLYAKSLWWILWAYYIPFLMFLWMLRKEELSLRNLSYGNFIVVGFCSMIIKIFFNGFEYITTTFLMPLVPLFYYSIKNKWDARLLFIRFVFSVCGISLAIAISFMLLSFQFFIAGERFEDGLNHIQHSFLKRTQIDKTAGRELAIVQRSKPKLNDVLKYYISQWKDVLKWYISRPDVIRFHNLGVNRVLKIRHFLIIFISISFILIFVIKIIRKKMVPPKIKALIISLWFAIIPPLSWFIVFSQHSLHHMKQDPIVWYMPYMFYGIALCGIFLKEILIISSTFLRNYRLRKKRL
jgi:hypothetical protein